MKRFLAAFKLAWAITKYQRYADQDEFWTKEDSDFLGSSTVVKKLLMRLQNASMKAGAEACAPSSGGEHRRGMAYGLVVAINLILTHFPQSAGQADIEEQELDDLIPERLVTPIRS